MIYLMSNLSDGELAQLARAPALHAGGQEFESPILHQFDSLALIDKGFYFAISHLYHFFKIFFYHNVTLNFITREVLICL